MITKFLWPKLEEVDLDKNLVRHHVTKQLPHSGERFRNSNISKYFDIERPPRSYDLTWFDYFLWVYLKSLYKLYESLIDRHIYDMRLNLVEKVPENWAHQIYSCRSDSNN